MPHFAYELLRVLYLVVLIATCGYCWLAGGRDEKRDASIHLVASFASLLATSLGRNAWTSPQIGLLAVDIATLAAFCYVALATDRWWPLWVAAFQLDAVATHLSKVMAPAALPHGYALLQGFWAYPLMIALVIGTRSYRRRAANERRGC